MGLTFFSLFGVLFTVLISALNSYKKNKIRGKNEIESYVIRKLYNFCNYFCLINGTTSSCKRNNRVHPIKPVLAGTAQIALFEENKDSENNLSLTVTDNLRTSSYYSATNGKNQNGLNVRKRLNTQTDIQLENLTPSPPHQIIIHEIRFYSESESNSKEKIRKNKIKKNVKT